MNRGRHVHDWILVISLALAFGFVGLNRVGIGYLLLPIVQEFQLEHWQAGLLVSGTSTAWAISAWLSGSISDRVGRKNVLLIGMYTAAGISAVIGLSWNFVSLFILRDLLGLGDGVSLPTGQSTIAERCNVSRRALYQGVFIGGYNLFGFAFGALVVTRLSTIYGWHWVFPIVGGFGVIIASALNRILPADLPQTERSAAGRLTASSFFSDLREILGVRGMPYATISFTLYLAWLGINIAFGALFLTQVRGYDLNDAGTILAISSGIGLSGVLIVPFVADTIGRKPAAIAAGIVGGVCYLIFALAPLPTVALVSVLTLGLVGATGVGPLAGATLPSELVPLRRGAAIGICNLFAAILGITLSPIIGGVLADRFGLAIAVVLGGLCLLLIAPIMSGVQETAPRVLLQRGVAPTGAAGLIRPMSS